MLKTKSPNHYSNTLRKAPHPVIIHYPISLSHNAVTIHYPISYSGNYPLWRHNINKIHWIEKKKREFQSRDSWGNTFCQCCKKVQDAAAQLLLSIQSLPHFSLGGSNNSGWVSWISIGLWLWVLFGGTEYRINPFFPLFYYFFLQL